MALCERRLIERNGFERLYVTGLKFGVFLSAPGVFNAACVVLISLFPINLLTFYVAGIHEGNVRLSRNSEAGAVFLDGGNRTRRQAGH